MSAGWLLHGGSLCHNVAECSEVFSKLNLSILSVHCCAGGLESLVVNTEALVVNTQPWQDFTAGALGVLDFLHVPPQAVIAKESTTVLHQGPCTSWGGFQMIKL